MTVNRAKISQSHIFENGRRQNKALDPVFDLAAKGIQSSATRDFLENIAVILLQAQIIISAAQARQMLCHATNIAVDGHLIVVENNDHRFFADSGIIQTFIGHTTGSGAVTNQRDHMIVLLLQCSCTGHTQCDRNGTGGMSGNESIGITFIRFRKSGDTPKLPKMPKIRLATGQQLMNIRLMTNVENQAVFHCIENGLDCNGKLNCAQIRGKMTACLGHIGNEIASNFVAQISPLLIIQAGKILMTVDIW